ncbi:MAG TPA: DUF5018 domain-containing protein [Candidatus Barnesiella merdipullorum]|nr:DUF5018 domain-containing protein [Candidatus Barnesiella merdipullorum]
MKTQKIYFFLCIAALFLSGISCNSTDEEEITYTLSESVRVTSFSLAANDSVLAHLDTIFFTIDLNGGQIYNADSLPKGTDVSALIANISFDNVAQAKIIMDRGDATKNDTIDYLATPTDSIDFTSKVSLVVTAQNGVTEKWYSVKVNVHQIDPDSLYWNTPFGMRTLPCGPGTTVTAQKAVYFKEKVYSFIEVNSTYTVYTTDNPYADNWTTQELNLPFTPNVKSVQATTDALYMLSQTGELYRSEDGTNWTSTGQSFYSLVGSWKSRLLGVVLDNGTYKHDCYPRPEGFTPYPVPANFPITGSSQMVTFVSEYDLDSPQSIMIGGRTASNKLTGATWGYDGEAWAQLGGAITPCEGALLFPYFTFTTSEYWITTRYTSWIAIGGREAGGVSDSVYVSINNGNTWSKAPDLLAMPSYIAPRAFASVLVVEADFAASQKSSPLWRFMPVRPMPAMAVTRATNDDYKIPYIYIFGGESDAGTTYNQIWRGAIGRLRYPPIP